MKAPGTPACQPDPKARTRPAGPQITPATCGQASNSTAMIRTPLIAVPRRGVLFAATGAVFAAVALATGLIASFACFSRASSFMAREAKWLN